MKVFTVAVVEAIQQKVDLKKVDPEDMKNDDSKKLAKLLGVKSLYNRHGFLKNKVKKNQLLQKAKSPRDMAKYLKTRVKHSVVENIIHYQFQIIWNTRTGEPATNHTFYQFCDTERTKEHFTYGPRLAHVQATLYKVRKKKGTSYLKSISKKKEKLCPKVYIRTAKGWKTWDANTKEFDNSEHDQLSWINESIKTFIDENADEQAVDEQQDYLEQCLSKPTLYWAVLDDTDFIPGEKLKLEEIGKTQVYVGKANNGIRGRWTKDKSNHCDMMKKCLDNVNDMETYDPSRLKGIQLVDARLALAKVRREKTALFVMKTFGDEVEKARRQLRASLDKARTYLRQLSEANSSNVNETYSYEDIDQPNSEDDETDSNEDQVNSDNEENDSNEDQVNSDNEETNSSEDQENSDNEENDSNEDQTNSDDDETDYKMNCDKSADSWNEDEISSDEDQTIHLDDVRVYLGDVQDFLDKAGAALDKAESRLDEAESSPGGAETHFDGAEAHLDEVQKFFNKAETRLEEFQEYLSDFEESQEWEEKVKKLQEELNAGTYDLRKALKITKLQVEELLIKTERNHLKGKRFPDTRLNIIPSKVCQKWNPKDMKYGMNSR